MGLGKKCHLKDKYDIKVPSRSGASILLPGKAHLYQGAGFGNSRRAAGVNPASVAEDLF